MKILLVLLLLSGCSYSFKPSIPVNEEILIEEMESIDRLEQIKIEMDKRLKELKNE